MKTYKFIYRHLRSKLFNCNNVSLPFTITIVLFVIAMVFSTPIKIITSILYFIMILEITRMLDDYVRSPHHRVKIRLLADATIIAAFREVIIILVDPTNIVTHLYILGIYLGAIIVILNIRYLLMKISPDEMENEYKNKENVCSN